VNVVNIVYVCAHLISSIQCESKKSPHDFRGRDFFIFSQTVENLIDFLHTLLCVPIYARLQIFIQLSPILTKLCHIKRDYPVHIICSQCPPSAKMRAFRGCVSRWFLVKC